MPGGAELFISDLHLSAREPATAERFLAFLGGPVHDAARLTILGDLFDCWAGDDDIEDPFNTRIVSALRNVANAGVPVAFMAGNRDFLVGNAFASATGVELLPDPCVRVIHGTRTLLTHGDTLCTGDTAYQAFRAEVRAPAWRESFLARPLAERKLMIGAFRDRSEAEKKIKPAALMDVAADAVTAALREHDAQALIHGHTHRQGHHVHAVEGRDRTRWALGDWHADRGQALCCAPEDWRFIP